MRLLAPAESYRLRAGHSYRTGMETSGLDAMPADPTWAYYPLVMADLDALRAKCDSLTEELADAALDLLREAVEGDEESARTEKRVTRARRSVEKAAALLGGTPAAD